MWGSVSAAPAQRSRPGETRKADRPTTAGDAQVPQKDGRSPRKGTCVGGRLQGHRKSGSTGVTHA